MKILFLCCTLLNVFCGLITLFEHGETLVSNVLTAYNNVHLAFEFNSATLWAGTPSLNNRSCWVSLLSFLPFPLIFHDLFLLAQTDKRYDLCWLATWEPLYSWKIFFENTQHPDLDISLCPCLINPLTHWLFSIKSCCNLHSLFSFLPVKEINTNKTTIVALK